MVTLVIALILVAAVFAVIFISERYRILFPFTIIMLSIPTLVLMILVARAFPPSSITLQESVVTQVVTGPMGRSLRLSNGITIRCHEADENRCKEAHAGDLVMYRSYDWSGFWREFEFVQVSQKAKG
jgi:hypothetical protein